MEAIYSQGRSEQEGREHPSAKPTHNKRAIYRNMKIAPHTASLTHTLINEFGRLEIITRFVIIHRTSALMSCKLVSFPVSNCNIQYSSPISHEILLKTSMVGHICGTSLLYHYQGGWNVSMRYREVGGQVEAFILVTIKQQIYYFE